MPARRWKSFDLSTDGKRVVISSRGEVWERPGQAGWADHFHHQQLVAQPRAAPTFSPDGKKIALITDETGEQEIAIYDAAARTRTR
jgi:tricorn protease